jgi:hypothetical protein
MQVHSVLETGIEPAQPPMDNLVREPAIRAHLLAQLPHSLLYGRQGDIDLGSAMVCDWRRLQHRNRIRDLSVPFVASADSDSKGAEGDGEGVAGEVWTKNQSTSTFGTSSLDRVVDGLL